MQVKSAQNQGSGSFSYQVIGDTYQFYEKPFLNIHVAYWHATAAAIIIIPLLVISMLIVCCVKCPVKKPNKTTPIDFETEIDDKNVTDY